MKLCVAITGAGGFLGSALTHRLLAAGAEVQALSRRPTTIPGVLWHAYELGGPLPAPEFFKKVDAVVHAAFSMDGAGPALEQRNRTAAEQLHAAARRHSRHFIFISSMSAHAEAVSSYGRAKWAIEQMLDPAVDTIVRPGLIIGPGGVYARMLDSLRRAPVLPVFFGGTQPVQPVGLDDVATALERIIDQRLAGSFNLGTPEPITVRQLYGRMLAATELHRRFLPLPGVLAVWALRMGEKLGLSLPVTAENLQGQKQLRMFETTASFARLSLVPTPLDQLPWASQPATP